MNHSTRRLTSLCCLAAVALLAGCAGPDPMRLSIKKTFEPEGFELKALMAACQPEDPAVWELTRIAENEDATVCVSQVTGEIPPHYFKKHHRVICILNGKGIAEVGGTRYRVNPGTTVTVPKGVIYRYIPTSPARYFAISMFSPRYNGKDIKYIKVPGQKKPKRRPKRKPAERPAPELVTSKIAAPEPAKPKPAEPTISAPKAATTKDVKPEVAKPRVPAHTPPTHKQPKTKTAKQLKQEMETLFARGLADFKAGDLWAAKAKLTKVRDSHVDLGGFMGGQRRKLAKTLAKIDELQSEAARKKINADMQALFEKGLQDWKAHKLVEAKEALTEVRKSGVDLGGMFGSKNKLLRRALADIDRKMGALARARAARPRVDRPTPKSVTAEIDKPKPATPKRPEATISAPKARPAKDAQPQAAKPETPAPAPPVATRAKTKAAKQLQQDMESLFARGLADFKAGRLQDAKAKLTKVRDSRVDLGGFLGGKRRKLAKTLAKIDALQSEAAKKKLKADMEVLFEKGLQDWKAHRLVPAKEALTKVKKSGVDLGGMFGSKNRLLRRALADIKRKMGALARVRAAQPRKAKPFKPADGRK